MPSGSELEDAGAAIGQRIHVVRAAAGQELDVAFSSIAQEKAGALIVANDPLFASLREQIIALAVRLPRGTGKKSSGTSS